MVCFQLTSGTVEHNGLAIDIDREVTFWPEVHDQGLVEVGIPRFEHNGLSNSHIVIGDEERNAAIRVGLIRRIQQIADTIFIATHHVRGIDKIIHGRSNRRLVFCFKDHLHG